MGMTMIEKILARGSGRDHVKPGDIVICEVDKAIQIDGPFNLTEPVPSKVWDPDRVAVILDHAVPAPSIADADGQRAARRFAAQHGISKFYDIGHQGIVHQVVLEEGLAVPGQILTCTDSHTCASGAVNCAARGLGRLEMLQVLCTGRTWYRVCPAIRYELVGELPPGAYGKDVFLTIAGRYGEHSNQNVEFGGPGLASLGLDDRSTIATMFAEVSAEFTTFPADQLVLDFLSGRCSEPFEPVTSDADASYADVRQFDLADVVPYVAKPDYVPHNTMPVTELEDVRIDQAFVGSCANGKLADIRIAAEVVRGKKIHAGVRFLVTPASQKVYLQAVRLGYVEALVEAGAVVTNSTCGACFGYHMGVVGAGETCVTSSTRNFKGRMGSPEARVFMASSATVAASAIAGRIVDPRPFLEACAAVGSEQRVGE
jgi:3-isopropylmalate/(R)-2-methylmalate dehydratase large subunit